MAKNDHHFSAKKFAKEKTKELKNLPFKNLIALSAVINILVISFVLILRDRLPPEVPLFYGLPRGEDQLAQSLGLVIPSALSLTILVINSILASFVKNDYLGKVLIVSGATTAIFASVTVLKISFLVGNF